jgi:rubrerythrin
MNALEMAIKLKTDAVNFYEESANSCGHPAGKKMFLSILEDEKQHLESLKQMKVDAEKLSPMKNVKAALETVKDDMRVRTACSLDETEAFKIAMDMERECIEFFEKRAEEAESEEERALFKKLAREEEEHYQVFSNTHAFLTDTGNWFMWDEHSIVEG